MSHLTTPAGDGGGRRISGERTAVGERTAAGERTAVRERPVLALDVGASRIRAAVVRPDGTLAARAEGVTRVADGPEAVLADAIALLHDVRARVRPELERRIDAVGISAPGPVDPFRGLLVDPPNLGREFHDVEFAMPIGAALGLPAVLDRDTNVAFLGELGFGAAWGIRDGLYLTVSTGIGGSIVAGGRLVGGPDGAAGELGHVLVDLEGPLCGCGARGHLEAISSGVGIARAAREAIAAGTAPGLAALEERVHPARLTARDVAAAEEAGDPAGAAIMEYARRAFGAALVGLVNVFAPELIVIGGSIARGQGERWLGPAREAVSRFAFRVPAARVRIVPAALGDDVGLVGALELVAARLGP
jgi:glucokinase